MDIHVCNYHMKVTFICRDCNAQFTRGMRKDWVIFLPDKFKLQISIMISFSTPRDKKGLI